MNPVTHFFASWLVADGVGLSRRDRIIVTVSGVFPDLDGIGAFPDLFNKYFRGQETYIYSTYHHSLLHGLPAAVAVALVAVWAGTNRFRVAAMSFIAVHLHMLLDLVGSRGPTKQDVWPISYLAPFSAGGTVSVPWQWQLNAWPNIIFTLILLAMVFRSAIVKGYTPIELLGTAHDKVLVEDIKKRWEQLRRALPNQAL
jgi:inner membrane protein